MATMKPGELLEALSEDMAKQLKDFQESLLAELGTRMEQMIQKSAEAAQDQAQKQDGSESKDGSKHPAGLCDAVECRDCQAALDKAKLALLHKVEERVPGTKEKLAEWEVMHSPVDVTL